MKIVIHQPEYLPWLGYFEKIINCDLFVLLDHVQFQKGFINRNKIKTAVGSQWLTVPIIHKYHRKSINEVRIDNQADWQKDHRFSLELNYSKSAYFKEYISFFQDVYRRKWEFLSELDIYLIENLMDMLGIKVPVIRSSALNVKGRSTELLVNICKEVGADTYFSGEGGKKYMDLEKFKEEKIKVAWQDYSHPEYRQQFNKVGFIPYMSAIDLLFNHGPASLNIINKSKIDIK